VVAFSFSFSGCRSNPSMKRQTNLAAEDMRMTKIVAPAHQSGHRKES